MSKLTSNKSQSCPNSTGSPSKKHSHYISEKLKASDFSFAQIIHHGFPYRPTCMAHNPKLGLIIVGTESGYLRVYGKEYVDRCFRDDESAAPVLFVALNTHSSQNKQSIRALSICEPSRISLWQLDEPYAFRMISRKFTKEKFSCAHLSHSGNLLLFGTEAGNVYILDALTLALSNQIVHWNRAVGPSFCDHPGPVVILETSPIDLQRIYIGYSPNVDSSENGSAYGLIIKWNLKRSTREHVVRTQSGITSMCWHFEGKSFLCGHVDGSLSLWNTKSLDKPVKVDHPHGPISPNTTSLTIPIKHIQIACLKSGDVRTIFAGGIHLDTTDRSRYLTVVKKRSTNVFQMDSPIVSLCLLFDANTGNLSEPIALAILLEEEIKFLDLRSDDCIFVDSPHSTQFGKQAITFIDYIAAPPSSLYYNLLKLHNYQNESGVSGGDTPSSLQNFPLTGGIPGQTIFPYNEIILTGHANGSICFWDCSAFDLSPMYSISAERYLYPASVHNTRTSSKSSNCSSLELVDDESLPANMEHKLSSDTADNSCSESVDTLSCPLAVESIRLVSTEPEHLVVVGAGGYVSLLKCNMQKSEPSEDMFEIAVLEIPIIDDIEKSPESPNNSGSNSKKQLLVKVRVACRRLVGFHPQLVCVFPVSRTVLSEVNDFAFNQENGLFFILVGTRLFLIDTTLKTIVSSFNVNSLRIQSDSLVCSGKLHHSPSLLVDRKSVSESSDQSLDTKSPIDMKECNVVDDGDDHGPSQQFVKQQSANVDETVVQASEEKTKKIQDIRSSSKTEKLKRGSIFRKLSVHTIKLVEKAVGQQNEKPSKESDQDFPDDQGLLLLMSCSISEDCEALTASSFTIWVVTSSSRIFPLGCSITQDENRTIKLTRNGEQFRINGRVLLIKVISIESMSNSAAVLKHWKPQTGNQLFIVCVSTCCVRICCLPDRCCVFEQTFACPVQAAWISALNDSLFVCTVDQDTAMLRTYSIPKITPLFQVNLPLTPKEFSCQLKRRLICSDFGILCCLLNPFEIVKMTIASNVAENISEMQACLSSSNDARSPQMDDSGRSARGKSENPSKSSSTYSLLRMFSPSDSFNQKTLFDSAVNKKEPSGVVEPPTAEHSKLFTSQVQTASSHAEASRMIQAGIERGERLQQLDMTTARMAENAREFGQRAKQLSELHKQRSEKWWQLWR